MGASSKCQAGDFISRLTPIFTYGVTPSTIGHVSQYIGGIFNIPSNGQCLGIILVATKALRKLRDMISSVPGFIQPIPEVSYVNHKVSRFALPICDIEVPKKF